MFKLYCLIKKEFLEEVSYRFNFLLRIFSILLHMLTFYFVSTIFAGAASTHLARYNGDYFSFVLIGLAFSGFFTTGLSTFSSEIRTEQTIGTLEILLTTRTPLSFILFARLVWNFIYDSFHLFVYLAAGVLLLKAKFTASTLYLLPLIMLLTMLSYSSLGLISAGFILVLKRGDPINYFFSMANQFLERKVVERTAELEQANRRLREEMREKEDFLLAVGHDLSAPLRNIAGMVGMIQVKHAQSLPEE
ncbi:hypothetical protein KKG41_07155, partial [Patescibacteria group bacterium]|nr:hypothetical protein [Patescibacteria group bacterium]